MIKNLFNLEQTLELYQESDDALKSLLADYCNSLDNQKNDQEKLEFQREEISQNIELLDSSLSTHCTLKGTYQAQADV